MCDPRCRVCEVGSPWRLCSPVKVLGGGLILGTVDVGP